MKLLFCMFHAIKGSIQGEFTKSIPRAAKGKKFHMLSPSQVITTPVNDQREHPHIRINHGYHLMFIGSCFSEYISAELMSLKFRVSVNPQGILFNPISISSCLNNVIKEKEFTNEDIFEDTVTKKVCHSWQHHSSFSCSEEKKDDMLLTMNAAIKSARSFISQTTSNTNTTNSTSTSSTTPQPVVIFVTLGTARVHKLRPHGLVVANCHKQPSSQFETTLLSVEDVVSSLREAFVACKTVNNDVQIVVTVSPVRHTRDGVIENSLSKSTLICAAHCLIKEFPSFVSYFPAYEYMIDELRDYRWYAEDMVHPTPLARKFILGKFASKYLTEEAQSLATRIDSINRNMNHVPFFPHTEAYRKHLSSTIASMEDIMQHKPIKQKQKQNIGINNDFNIDFSKEIVLLKCKLNSLQ